MRSVSIVGTKKSGKTTVVERLLPTLRGQGLMVGTLKFIHHEGFTIHADGRDTARHWEAGADFSIALAPGETTLVRRTGGDHDALQDLEGMVPADTDILLCEGLVLGGEGVRSVVCAREEGEVATFVAGLPRKANVVAVSGIVAKGTSSVGGTVALDVTRDGDLARLADLVLG